MGDIAMNMNDRARTAVSTRSSERARDYEPPEVIDYGSLGELTLSGTAPLSDAFGGAASGGS